MKKQSKAPENKYNIYLAVLVAICLAIFVYFKISSGSGKNTMTELGDGIESHRQNSSSKDIIPTGSHGQVIYHRYYSLSYIEENEQAEWVAYELSAENLKKPHVKYNRRFNDDKEVRTQSAFHHDYTNTGYTRGHLAPAGDMSFDIQALRECYLMSNMSPQLRSFNNGVWKELEEQTRDWAFQKGRLYIVTGPLFSGHKAHKIGQNEIAVPDQFYKAILYIAENENAMAIGFIIPHERCELSLDNYAVPIDAIEQKTGLNLYENILSENNEKRVEAHFDINRWPISEARYQIRVAKWNKE